MPKFLIDENLSPFLARDLRKLRYIAKAISEVGLKGKSDEEIISFAAKKKYIIITADIEFGEMFYRYKGKVSILLLKSKSQNKKAFVNIIGWLHRNKVLPEIGIGNFLVVASMGIYRIRRFSE